MRQKQTTDHEYKVQAVKLAKAIGQAKAAKELRESRDEHLTYDGWHGQLSWQFLTLELACQTLAKAL